jgi:transcriptional regulator with XRE-family HTH domain
MSSEIIEPSAARKYPMKTRGRPPKKTGPPRYANRLRELRQRLGLSQQEVATAAGISSAYYGALERGDKRINADTAQRLHAPLRCSVSDLLSGTRGVSVPVRFAIAAAEPGGRLDSFELPEPHERLQPGRVAEPEECFAAEIADDSADRDFASGTVLLLRPPAALREPLRAGAKVVARFFLDGDAGGDRGRDAGGDTGGDVRRATYEVLYGILDRNILGDLMLITRTRNRLIPRHALIRAAASARSGPSESAAAESARDGTIDYRHSPADPAEILGVVVYAMGPVENRLG